jgi:hypothetical protein
VEGKPAHDLAPATTFNQWRYVLTDVLVELRVPFPAGQVKKNEKNLDYISIDGYIRRFLEVVGLGYDFVVTQSSVTLLPEDMSTSTGKRQYLAQVTGAIHIHGTPTTPSSARPGASRSGTGADVSFDPDKAVKTAQAEAFKKAAHQFGVALELWDEDHRADLEVVRRGAGGSEAALKKAVFDLAKKRLDKKKPTVAEVAELFNVEPGDLSSKSTLEQILRTEGAL